VQGLVTYSQRLRELALSDSQILLINHQEVIFASHQLHRVLVKHLV
jgi:hypothetical protein